MTLQREDKVLLAGGAIAVAGLVAGVITGEPKYIDIAVAGIALGGVGKAILPPEAVHPAPVTVVVNGRNYTQQPDGTLTPA